MNRVHWSFYSILLTLFLGVVLMSVSWRFEASNFGDLLHAGKPKTLEQVGYFFVHKDPELFRQHPSARAQRSDHGLKSYFFSAKYRPLTYLTIALENHFFDYHEKYYLLFAMILHLLAAGMLFYFLQRIFSWYAACLGTLFFLCNQAVGAWLGSVSHQQYQLELFMFFIVALLLKKHLDSGKLRYLMMSLVIFFAALFFRETLVIFPFWAFIFVAFYQKNFKEFDFFKPILTFISYSLFSILYIVLRGVHYPLNFDYYYAKLSPSNLFEGRFDDLRLFLDDVLGVVFFPGERTFKIIMLLFILAALLEIFRRSTYKEHVIFFVSSGLLFMWPLIFRHYDPRYLYLPLIFFIIGFLFLIKDLGNHYFKKIIFSLCLMLCATHACFFGARMDARMNEAQAFNRNIDAFLQHSFDEKKMVCFLNTPYECFGNGTMEALCLKAQAKGIQIFEPSLDAEFSKQSVELLAELEKDISQENIALYAWDDAEKHFVAWDDTSKIRC